MDDLSGARVAVIGMGVFGFSIALSLLRRGAAVFLYGYEDPSETASGVAAGMLAPAFETVLDPASSGHFPLLSAARELWPEFIASLGMPAVTLNRSGAVWAFGVNEAARGEALFNQLRKQGANAEYLDADVLLRLQPELSEHLVGGVFTPDDWALDARTLLSAMAQAFRREGGALVSGRVEPSRDGATLNSVAIAADSIVLAGGADVSDWLAWAPELAVVEPIKGQILHYGAPPLGGPVVRGAFGYVAPQAGGAIVGASMEVGRTDRQTDQQTLGALRAGAAQLFSHLDRSPSQGGVGVRASTPDGLPLVGWSSRPGLLLALGARRNGWLLGPMVGHQIAARLLGQTPDPFGQAFDPLRTFSGPPQPRPGATVAGS